MEDALEYQKGINDALVEHYQIVQQQIESLKPALQHYLWTAERHDSMQQMLTDPNLLADWTLQMLGEGGIYGQDRYPQQPGVGQSQYQQPGMGLPSRPVFPSIPSPVQGSNVAGDRWSAFEQAMEIDPSQAWRYIDSLSAQDFQARQIVGLS